MRRTSSFLSLFLSLILTGYSLGQDISLELKGNVQIVKVDKVVVIQEDRTVVKALPLSIVAPKVAEADYTWTYPQGVIANDAGNQLDISIAPRGDLTVGVKILSVKDGKLITQRGKLTFTLGDVAPPTPPTPPGPTPPTPPTPSPRPFPVAGFRVLVVYDVDANDLPVLTAKQGDELYGKDLADYLNAKCVKEDGQTEFRAYKRTINQSNMPERWRQAMGRTVSTPGNRIIISDGVNGSYEGPLPDGGILDLLKKYGG